MKFYGVYRPRIQPPGFGFPVFSNNKGKLVQNFKNGKVTGFLYIDIEGEIIVPPSDVEGQVVPKIGDDVWYAFQFMDGKVRMGTKSELRKLLKFNMKSLKPFKYVMEDVTDFLKK